MKIDKKFSVTRFCALLIVACVFAVSTIQMCVFAQEIDAPMPPQTAPSSLFTQEQELMAADSAASDQFGSAIAICGDLAVIGSPTAKVGGTASIGAACVFKGMGNDRAQKNKLAASDSCGDDGFESSVKFISSGQTVQVKNTSTGATSSEFMFTRPNP